MLSDLRKTAFFAAELSFILFLFASPAPAQTTLTASLAGFSFSSGLVPGVPPAEPARTPVAQPAVTGRHGTLSLPASLSFFPADTTAFSGSGPAFQPATVPLEASWDESEPGWMDRMESYFPDYDTRFMETVALPVKAFSRGRLQVSIFETTVSESYFFWGLPGGGATQSLDSTDPGFYPGIKHPPLDQSFGLSLTARFDGRDAGPPDDSFVRGIRSALRTCRSLLPL